MKHTKAPWLMNTTKRFMDNKGLAITDSDSILICEVSHDLSQLSIREYEANAKLIVAAPDLLLVCQKALESEIDGSYVSASNWWKAMKDTVKKATE